MDGDGMLVPAETQAPLKKKTAVSRSWILLIQTGKRTILDVDKYTIMRRVHIHARDLRILDPLLSYPSAILGTEKVIVLNLEVLLRDPFDDNVVPIVGELQRRLVLISASLKGQGEEEQPAGVRDDAETGEEHEFPFEFQALEVALEGICSYLDACTRELEADACPALDELTSRDELEQLLDNDDDMADLYLSRKLAMTSSLVSGYGAPNWSFSSPTVGSRIPRTSRTSTVTVRPEDDIEELEMLLAAYFMQIDGTLNKLTMLREYIDDMEDYINMQLDNHRNQLIQLELFLCSGTVCLSVYSPVAAIFGMNIHYTWKEGHGYVFKWVVVVTGMLCASLFLSIISYARHKGLLGS